MYQQRAEPDQAPSPAEAPGGPDLWQPPAISEAGLTAIPDAARYVVVDDLDGPTAVLVSAPWPTVDEHGRLAFGPTADRHTLARARATLQAVVDDARSDAGAPAPTRSLRIGDAFLIVPIDDDSAGAWEIVIDVTSDARDAAKTALYSAVTPRVDERYAAEVGLVDPERAREPGPELGPGPTASPRV